MKGQVDGLSVHFMSWAISVFHIKQRTMYFHWTETIALLNKGISDPVGATYLQLFDLLFRVSFTIL